MAEEPEQDRDIVQAINEQLDAQALMTAIGFHTDKIRVLGKSLKTHCPVHQDDKFATLIVDPTRRTYKCMVSTCPAFKGGDLVELYAMVTGKDPIAAAIEAAQITGLKVEGEMVEELLTTYLSFSQHAAEEGDLDTAQRYLADAGRLSPENLEIALLSAQLAERGGKTDEACSTYRNVGDMMLANGDLAGAEDIWRNHLLRLKPTCPEYWLILADLLERQEKQHETRDVLLQLCDYYEAENTPGENVPLFERMIEIVENDPAMRCRYARALAARETLGVACEQFVAAANMYRDDEKLELAIETLNEALKLDENNTEVNDTLADIHLNTGDEEVALELWLRQGSLCLEKNQFVDAESLFQKVLNVDADNLKACEGMIPVMHEKGDQTGEIKARLRVCDMYREAGRKEDAIAQAFAIKGIAPDSTDWRAKAAERLVELVGQAESNKEFLEIARLRLEQSDANGAEVIFNKLLNTSPNDAELCHNIASCYVDHNEPERALDVYISRARNFFEKGDADTALDLCVYGLLVEERHAQLLQLQFDSQMETNNIDDAVNSIALLSEVLLESDNGAQAMANVERALVSSPDHPVLLAQLGELHEAIGQPEEAIAVYLRLADLNAEAGQAENNLALFEKIELLEPDNLDVRARRAQTFEALGRREEAIDAYDALATTHRDLRQFDEAIATLAKIREMEPQRHDTFLAMMDVYECAKQMDAYKTTLLELIKLCEDQDNLETAEKYFAQLNEKFPGDLAAVERSIELEMRRGTDKNVIADKLKELADKHRNKGNPEDHIRLLDRVCELVPERRDVHLALSVAYEEQKDIPRAFDTLLNFVNLLYEKGDGDNAHEVLEQAVRLANTDAKLLYRACQQYRDLGLNDDAVQVIRKRLNSIGDEEDFHPEPLVPLCEFGHELSPDDPVIATWLVNLYFRVDRAEDGQRLGMDLGKHFESEHKKQLAFELYQQLKELDPTGEEQRLRLVEIYRDGEETDEAGTELLELVAIAREAQNEPKLEEYLAGVVALYPTSIDMGTEYAACLERREKPHDAFVEYRRLLTQAKNQNTTESLAHLYDKVLELAKNETDTKSLRHEYLEFLEAQGNNVAAAEQAVALANAYADAGDIDTATELTQRASKLAPDAIETRRGMAELLFKLGKTNEAVNELVETATLLLNQAAPERALELLALAVQHDPENTTILKTMVRGRVANEETDAAISSLEMIAAINEQRGMTADNESVWHEVLELMPDHPEARLGLVRVYEAIGGDRNADALEVLQELAEEAEAANQFDQSIALYRRMAELDASLIECHTALARLYLETQKYPSALAEFVVLGEMYHERKELKNAFDCYEKALELDAESPDILKALIDLSQLTKNNDKYTDYCLRLATVFGKNDAPADAIPLLEGILALDPEDTDTLLLLAGYLANNDETKRAIDTFLEIARVHTKENNANEAAAALARALQLGPEDPVVLTKIGSHHLSLKQNEEAAKHLEAAFWHYEARGAEKEALEVANKLIEAKPKNAGWRERRADLLLRQSKAEEGARELLAAIDLLDSVPDRQVNLLFRLIEIEPDTRTHQERLAKALLAQGRREEAGQRFLELARGYLRDKEFTDALPNALEARKLDDSSPEIHMVLAEIHQGLCNDLAAIEEYTWVGRYFTDNDAPEDAALAFEKAVQIDPDNMELLEALAESCERRQQTAEAIKQWCRIAELHTLNETYDKAFKVLERARALDPNTTQVRVLIAETYEQSGDQEKATDEYIEVMRLRVAEGLIEEANQLFETLIDSDPRPELYRKAATIFEENGIPELASHQYECLARREFENEQFEDAEQSCREAIRLKPNDIGSRELLAEILQRLDQYSDAAGVLIEVARLYRDASALEKALAALQTATELRPNDVEARQQLASLYDRLGMTDKYAESLEFLSELYLLANKPQESVEVLEKLVALRPNDTRTRAHYIEQSSKLTNPTDLLPHYYRLAEIHVGHRAIREAIKVLENALIAAPEDLETHRRLLPLVKDVGENERALVIAGKIAHLYIEKNQPREALNILNGLKNLGEEQPTFHLSMADVYIAQNANGMALRELEKAANLYAQSGQLNEKADVLKRHIAIDPQNVNTHQELIALLREIGRHEKALEMQMGLAEVFNERGLHDLAEAEYRAIIEVNPDHEQAWLALFACHLNIGVESDLFDDYIAYAEHHASKDDHEKALHYVGKIIHLDPANIPARQKYIELYLATGAEEEELCQDYLVLADLLIAANRIDEGIALYSKIMSIDPDNLEARDRLSETQADRSAGRPITKRELKNIPTERPHETHRRSKPIDALRRDEENAETLAGPRPRAWDDETDEGTQQRKEDTTDSFAARMLASEMDSMDEEDDASAFEMVAKNYRQILSINPQNANVRIKLADVLDQLGNHDESIEQLMQATDILFQKGDMNTCIQVCERILETKPTDQKTRLRLRQAYNKRDAFKALESAILFTDKMSSDTETGDTKHRPPRDN